MPSFLLSQESSERKIGLTSPSHRLFGVPAFAWAKATAVWGSQQKRRPRRWSVAAGVVVGQRRFCFDTEPCKLAGLICLGFPRVGKTGPLPLGGSGLGLDYFAERRHAQWCVSPPPLTLSLPSRQYPSSLALRFHNSFSCLASVLCTGSGDATGKARVRGERELGNDRSRRTIRGK